MEKIRYSLADVRQPSLKPEVKCLEPLRELVPDEAYLLRERPGSEYAREINVMSRSVDLDYAETVEGLLISAKY